ncbi:hypothetical protein RFI_07242, partial [Reticulomyxa filosa]
MTSFLTSLRPHCSHPYSVLQRRSLLLSTWVVSRKPFGTSAKNIGERKTKGMGEQLEQIETQLKSLKKRNKFQSWFSFQNVRFTPVILCLLFLMVANGKVKQEVEREKKRRKTEKKVIQIRTANIRNSVSEARSAWFAGDTVTFSNLIKLIRRAAHDDTVLGISLVLEQEELREFQRQGKFVMSYGKTISLKDLVLASCSDNIYLQPTAVINTNGVSIAGVFYKGLLDRLGIVPFVVKREKYKSLMDRFLLEGFSKECREAMESIGKDLFDQYLFFIAEKLNITFEEAQRIIDTSPLTPDEAIALRLADEEIHWRQFQCKLSEMCYLQKQVPPSQSIDSVTPAQYLATSRYKFKKSLQLLQQNQDEIFFPSHSTQFQFQFQLQTLRTYSISTNQTPQNYCFDQYFGCYCY